MKEVYGDLVEMAKAREFDIIAHGCNCLGCMGAGIAKQIATAFPEVAEVDRRAVAYMGKMSAVWITMDHHKPFRVLNWYTQKGLGSPRTGDTLHMRLKAIRSCAEYTAYLIRMGVGGKAESLGIPLIGCGLARLPESKVLPILEEVFDGMDVTLVRYQKR